MSNNEKTFGDSLGAIFSEVLNGLGDELLKAENDEQRKMRTTKKANDVNIGGDAKDFFEKNKPTQVSFKDLKEMVDTFIHGDFNVEPPKEKTITSERKKPEFNDFAYKTKEARITGKQMNLPKDLVYIDERMLGAGGSYYLTCNHFVDTCLRIVSYPKTNDVEIKYSNPNSKSPLATKEIDLKFSVPYYLSVEKVILDYEGGVLMLRFLTKHESLDRMILK